MKSVLVAIALTLPVAGCTPFWVTQEVRDRDNAKAWASVVVVAKDPAPKECDPFAPLPVLKSGETTAKESAKYTSNLIWWATAAKRDHDKCGVWAKGQR